MASSAGGMMFPLSIRQNSLFAPPNFQSSQTIPERAVIVKHLPVLIRCWVLGVGCWTSHRPPPDTHHLSPVTYHLSPVTYHPSPMLSAHAPAARLRRVERCPLVAPSAVSSSTVSSIASGATGRSAARAVSSAPDIVASTVAWRTAKQ